MTMMRNFADQQKLVEHEEEHQPEENSSHSFTDTLLQPLKKLKKQMIKDGKLLEGEGEVQSPSTITDLSLPPLTPRYPLPPEGGDIDDFQDWAEEYGRVKKLNAALDNLPTQIRSCRDPATRAAVVAPDDKMLLLLVADFVVSISYSFFNVDINQDVTEYCTGFIISSDKINKKARILTCDYIVCGEAETNCKVNVHWSYMKESLMEAELLFVSRHYRIALLEIPIDVHSVVPQLKIPSFGSCPNYCEEVFALARDKDLWLMARRGKIMQLQTGHMFRSHCLFVDYELPKCGAGGPVVNHCGDVVGMSVHYDTGISAILSISTVISCVNMWTEFGCIARPLLEMRFRNVDFVDELSGPGLGGFIVDRVGIDSAAWELGIRRGNVITFDGHRSTPLAKFEDFLLSCGAAHLRGKHTVADFKLEVCDRDKGVKGDINLRVPFCDVSKDSRH